MKSNAKKYFFFLILFSFIFIFPVSSVSAATQIEENQTTITHDWLYVKPLTDQVDSRLHFYSGAESLYDATRLPTKDHGNGLFEFAYDTHFGFTVIVYTKEDLYSIFDNINTNAIQTYWWLIYSYYALCGQYQYTKEYGISYSTIDFGSSINRRYFNTEIPITVGLNPDITFYDFSGQTIGGLPIANANFNYLVRNVRMVEYDTKELGKYDDIIKDQVSKDRTDVNINVENLGNTETVITRAYDIVKDMNLGTQLWGDWVTSTDGPGQQGRKNTNPASYNNKEFSDFTFYHPVEIQPRVEVTQRQVWVDGAELEIGKCLNFYKVRKFQGYNLITPAEAENIPGIYPDDYVPNVYQKAHVFNYGMRLNFTANIQFTCNISIDNYEQYEGSINWPLFEQGDFIWTFLQGGTDELTLVTPETPGDWFKRLFRNLFGGIGFWIIVIIVVILGVIIFVVLTNAAVKVYSAKTNKRKFY